jgi:type IV pilus assembly protein PilY1
MKKALTTLLVGLGLLHGAVAQAQDAADLANPEPLVLLLLDSSGSMERMTGGPTAPLPRCTGTAINPSQRNRWATMVEALSGSWRNDEYFCTQVPRTDSSLPDYRYVLPHHRLPAGISQLSDGILDVYLERVRFAMMTFDNTYTFRVAPDYANQVLWPRTDFLTREAAGWNSGMQGEYSYGEPQTLRFQGCETTFMVDTGARNGGASMGRLISMGGDADRDAVNQMIQADLLNIRPYGATPTSSFLDDAAYYLQNHPDVTTGDLWSSCRKKYVILLTDGQPDAEFRDPRFDCESVDGCPYRRAEEIAADLCQYSTSEARCTGMVDGVFVVAFDVADDASLAQLNAIAERGGTEQALLAANRAELMAQLGYILDSAATNTTTRTRPAFATGAGTFTGTPTQLEFNAGFQVASAGAPWTGVLERTRYLCDGLNPVAEPTSSRVRFQDVLNSRTTRRRILTVLPSTASDVRSNLLGTQAVSSSVGGTLYPNTVRDLELVDFETSRVRPEHLNLSGTTAEQNARRDQIVQWIHGTSTDRAGRRLSDIYHSSPVTVGSPAVDVADEDYNLFRRRPEVATRPTVVYVGTNDGVLHAFLADAWTDPSSGDDLPAGHELWGFIPPMLLPKLDAASSSHQIMLDGTAVARDVYFGRTPGAAPSADTYHTVLVMGYRGGDAGYFALDITDPLNPSFLWQFVGDTRSGATPFGNSYGRPGLGQMAMTVGSAVEERGLALLPGGYGSLDTARTLSTGTAGCTPDGMGVAEITSGTSSVRAKQRCWTTTGRTMAWVDLASGEVVRLFDSTSFNAPLTGSVALYPADVGAVAQRAFFADADGVLWAADFSASSPDSWVVRPMHDVFWDARATEGQPIFDPPLVSIDLSGNLVVMLGTGDVDNLGSSASNRVVSVSELRTISSTTGASSYSTDLNWEVRLRPGEKVTGAIELFESTLYFATYEGGASSDACALGRGRLWGLDYRQRGGTAPVGYTDVSGRFPLARFQSSVGSGVYDAHFMGPYDNQLILGVGVTQRPTCTLGSNEIDPFIGTRYRVTNVGGGTFTLTAQLSGVTSTSGMSVPTISVALPAPQSFTTLTGIAGRVDN